MYISSIIYQGLGMTLMIEFANKLKYYTGADKKAHLV